MKDLSFTYRVLSYFPLGWLVLFALFVLRTYLKLGHLPSYNNPDPKDLGFSIHHSIVFFGLFIVCIAMLFWGLCTIILAIKNRKSIRIADVTFFLAGTIFVCYLDL